MSKKYISKFDRLYKEAIEDDSIYPEDEPMSDEIESSPEEDMTDDVDNVNVTITITKDQADLLREII